MDSTSHETVFFALAQRLAVDPLAFEAEQHLYEDWGLTSIDLILVSITIEDALDILIPMDRLENVQTIGDLVAAVNGVAEDASLHARFAPAQLDAAQGAQ